MSITSDDVETKGLSPKRTRTDEGAVTERDIDELIKADQYSKAQNNARPGHGLKISQTKPPASAM